MDSDVCFQAIYLISYSNLSSIISFFLSTHFLELAIQLFDETRTTLFFNPKNKKESLTYSNHYHYLKHVNIRLLYKSYTYPFYCINLIHALSIFVSYARINEYFPNTNSVNLRREHQEFKTNKQHPNPMVPALLVSLEHMRSRFNLLDT